MILIIWLILFQIQISLNFHIKNSLFGMPIKIKNEFLLEFNDEHRSGNFSNFLYFNKSLFVTGTNYVYKLNSVNISDKSWKSYKESFINPSNNLYKNSSSMKNFIKLMIYREKTQDLIICGTNLGKPHIKDLNVNDFSSIVEFDGHYLCPGIENSQNLGLISYENTLNSQLSNKGLMYSAIWKTNRVHKTNGIFSRYGIYRQEIDVASKTLKSLPDINWLWEPNFISIIDYKDKIYYFFTEFSIEEFSETKILKRISRVARVCKKDHGIRSKKYLNLNNIWLSFRKIALNCDEKYHNLIQVKKVDKNLILIFYDESLGSVLCETDMEHVENMLNQKKFWINRSIDLKNHNVNFLDNDFDCDNLPDGQITNDNNSNDHNLGDEDYDYYKKEFIGSNSKNKFIQNHDDLEELNIFLSQNTILNSRITSQFQVSFPLIITSVDFNLNIEKHESIFFFGTSIGTIIILHKNSNEFEEPVFLKFDSFKSINISEILIQDHNIYVSSSTSVYQIKYRDLLKKHCEEINECFKCVKFYFCSWAAEKCFYDEYMYNTVSECNLTINTLNLTEGDNAKLFCQKENLGGLSFWKKDSNWLNHSKIEYYLNDGVLYLVNVTDKYNGLYSCISEFGETIHKTDLKIFSYKNDQNGKSFNNSISFEDRGQNLTSILERFNEIIDYFEKECINLKN